MNTFDIFLSYSSNDKERVLQLAHDLTSKGFSVWLDEWQIRVGDPITQKIGSGLKNSSFLGIWLTDNAVKSEWVQKEWQAKFRDEAKTNNVTVLPLLAEKCEVPFLLHDKMYADFSQNYQHGLAKLLLVLKKSDRFKPTIEDESNRITIPNEIRDAIHDQEDIIDLSTCNFIGREFVFRRIEAFLKKNRRGYFVIKGDPGIGKTALASQWVKEHGSVHHFNKLVGGPNDSKEFLKNVSAQLISKYNLQDQRLADNTDELNRLLRAAVEKLHDTAEKVIVVVDALDEVKLDSDDYKKEDYQNVLLLPVILPDNVYFVTTVRRDADVPFFIQCEQEHYLIENTSPENTADITKYIEQHLELPGIKEYIADHDIDAEAFIVFMLSKSERNFMYLRYVLPEIEAGEYTDLDLKAIPQGLLGYYETHWKRMQSQTPDEEWFKYKLPVVVGLTVVPEPVSIKLIGEFAGVTELSRVAKVIEEWKQFLHEIRVDYEGGLQSRYCMYHASFYDFLSDLEQVKAEQVSLMGAREKMVDAMKDGLYEDVDDEEV